MSAMMMFLILFGLFGVLAAYLKEKSRREDQKNELESVRRKIEAREKRVSRGEDLTKTDEEKRAERRRKRRRG